MKLCHTAEKSQNILIAIYSAKDGDKENIKRFNKARTKINRCLKCNTIKRLLIWLFYLCLCCVADVIQLWLFIVILIFRFVVDRVLDTSYNHDEYFDKGEHTHANHKTEYVHRIWFFGIIVLYIVSRRGQYKRYVLSESVPEDKWIKHRIAGHVNIGVIFLCIRNSQ